MGSSNELTVTERASLQVQTYELGGQPVALPFAKTWGWSSPNTELNVIMPWGDGAAVRRHSHLKHCEMVTYSE